MNLGEDKLADIRLKDLIDVKSLQTIQDYYSRLTGIASIITDENGVPITQGSNFTEFCYELTRCSREGLKRCEACDARGAELTAESGKAVVYKCHAGLYDFAAPIKVDNQIIGSFVAGQVATVPLSEEMIRDTAYDLHINPDLYVEAAKKVHVMGQDQIVSAADFIYVLANILSELAYKNFQTQRRVQAIDNQLRMKTELFSNTNASMSRTLNELKEILEDAREAQPGVAEEKLAEAAKIVQLMNDALVVTTQFMDDGDMDDEIAESQYNLKRLCEGIYATVKPKFTAQERDVELVIGVDVPNNLYGDVTRIRQIIAQFVDTAMNFSKFGAVQLNVGCEKTAYGLTLVYDIIGENFELSDDEAAMIDSVLTDGDYHIEDENKNLRGLAMPLKLLGTVYGEAQLEVLDGDRFNLRISIPQIEY